MVHGSTAVRKPGSFEPLENFPTIPLTVHISPNTVTSMPYNIYLHRQKNWNFTEIRRDDDTVLTDPEHPGVELRIPRGVNIIGWDSQRNERISVRNVPPDRLPLKPLPDTAGVRSVYMFHFDKVGGGIPDKPVPFKAPNDLGLLPGEKAVLWYFDESPHEGEAPNDWAIAGTGTVTPDGRHIVSDPGVGIPKFCCGATAWGGQSASTGTSGPEGDCGKAGDPVDLATGYFIHDNTDLFIPGIIPIKIKRYYRNRESGSAVTGSIGLGAFGKGTYFEYDWWLNTYQSMLLLIKPGNYQYQFAQQPDGSYINTMNPEFKGAIITLNPDGTKSLRMTDGTLYSFNSFGELVGIADRNANAITITRVHGSPDQGGHISSITTTDGKSVTFNSTYVMGGYFFRIDSITDHTGRTVSYAYETDPFSYYPRLKSVILTDRGNIAYGYDSSGRMNSVTDHTGTVTNIYNTDNRVTQQTHADGGVYTFNYTTAGGNITETSMTSPNGAVTTWRFYDDSGAYRNGYITKKISPDGTTTYTRQAGTNLKLSVTDPLGRQTAYTYYANGQVNTVTDALGNTTTYAYEPYYGLPAQVTDARSKTTTYTYTYGSGNRITKVDIRDPLSSLTTINYNASGMPASIMNPNANTTTFLYENTNRPGELTKIIDPLNNSIKITYNNFGMPVEIKDAKDKSAFYAYDPVGKVTSTTDANGNTIDYYYNPGGNLSLVIDAKGNVIQYQYDDRGRPIKMTDQLGRYETYTYYRGSEITPTTGDNLKSVTDRKGQTTTFNQYDAMNRLKMVTYHDGSTTQYTYDAAGRVTGINDSISGVISYFYNDFGCGSSCGGRGMDRIAQETTPLGTINYTYDNLGRRATMTVAGQPEVSYTYDDAGRLTGISRDGRTWSFDYDPGSRRTSLQAPLASQNLTATSSYDAANRLLEMLIQGPSQIEHLLYEYDPNGRRMKSTRNASQPLGNALTNTSYNDANEMLTLTSGGSAKNMTYDANGNLLTVTNSCGTANYTWDARNRLASINGFNTDCSTLTASFSYDALGRRTAKTVNSITTQYLYDGMDIVQEKQNGEVTANYIRTLNIDEPLTRIKTDGTIRHYVRDALGSIIALTDDTGVTKTTYTYDPFGNVTVTGEASDNPFQYTGRENDGTGLYYYRARYYSPEMQRFISEDPIGLKGGDVNFYRYVRNGPVNWFDPKGLTPEIECLDEINWAQFAWGAFETVFEGPSLFAFGFAFPTGVTIMFGPAAGFLTLPSSPAFIGGGYMMMKSGWSHIDDSFSGYRKCKEKKGKCE